jgi:hypothetical protein
MGKSIHHRQIFTELFHYIRKVAKKCTEQNTGNKYQKNHQRPGKGETPEQKIDIYHLAILERKNDHQNQQ